MVCDLEPEILTAPPGELRSLKYPFLTHIAMVESDAPLGAIELWESFLARGADVAPGWLFQVGECFECFWVG